LSSVIQKSRILLEAIKPEKDKEEWSATEISKKLEIPVQTVHRLLNSLSEAGFVSKSMETKKFRLSFNLIQMGFALRNSLSVYQNSLPIMEKLAEKAKQCTCLTVIEDIEGIVVNWNNPTSALDVDPSLLRNPLHIGAANKVLLTYLPSSLKNRTISSLCSMDPTLPKEMLENELKLIKQQGCAITVGEISEGIADIAAPIFSWEEKIVAAVSVLIPISTVNTQRIEELVSLTIKAAEDISEELGFYK